MTKLITSIMLWCLSAYHIQAQTQTGVFRTTAGNTTYHQFVRDGTGAAVYINQVNTTYPILCLASGTEVAGTIGIKFIVENDGKVGIGTKTPTEMLSVNGNIRAKEVKVETANWPDYVFADDYELPDLKETETFIKINKHLPDMPSAAAVEKDGVSLGEMNRKLLEKVEELTLYLIEKDKVVDELMNRIDALEKK